LFRLIVIAATTFSLFPTAGAAPLPTPEQFAGFRMGTDKKLLRWDKIVEYMKLAAAASPRIKTEEYGKTTNGHPFLVLTISSPDTISSLAKYQATQRRLAYPRDLNESEAESVISGHKAVLLITCNIHSTEIGSSQMALELVHRLATEDSPFVRSILNRVIFLLVPSLNPDGQVIVTDWYNKNVGTPFEYSPLNELYHKYTGHDNNRDAFMNTQVESRLINKLTYKDWFPQVFLDEHQMGSSGARIFVPPFRNPINLNVDPMIWELNGLLGYAMGAALHDKGYTGIINDAQYTSWWQGGFLMQAWWHNMIGLLTEVASVNVATPIEQQRARLGETAQTPEISREEMRRMDPRRPLPPPRDTVARNTYPRPWLGGKWTLRDIVDYELTATYGLLETVANNKDLLVRTFYRLNRKQIELGQKESPYAWVVPAAQHDRPVAVRMLQILDELGVEVHRARDAFEGGGRKYEAGAHVVLMSQPFRAFAKDMLEKQTYLAQRGAGGTIERPYDVTGWTLPLQMGVEAVEVAKKFDANLELVSPVVITPGRFEAGKGAVAWRISHTQNNSFIAVNRLLKAGATVGWAPDGSIVARSREDLTAKMRELSQSLGVDIQASSFLPPQVRSLKTPRIGHYQPPMPSMDEGWTRWLLEQYEFPYHRLTKDEVRAGKLRERFDAILFADIPKQTLVRGVSSEWARPELRGGLGEEGVAVLRDFVREGGTVVAIGSSTLLPVEDFPLPLKNALKGLRPDQFSCPGSILKIFVDPGSPAGYGMQGTASAYFYNDVAFEPAPALGGSTVRVIARYPAGDILASGWIGGEQYLQDRIAAAEVSFGKGRVILLGFKAQNRAQPHGTFKLLFNSLHYSALDAASAGSGASASTSGNGAP
jgi:hypothetical protein